MSTNESQQQQQQQNDGSSIIFRDDDDSTVGSDGGAMLSDLPSFDSEEEVSVGTSDSGIVDTTAAAVDANNNNNKNATTGFEDEEDDLLEIKADNSSSEEEDDQNRGKMALLVLAVVAAVALGLGLGLGLTTGSGSGDDSARTTTSGPGTPLFPAGGGGSCLKSKNDFNTDEIIMTFNVKKDFVNPEIDDDDGENSNNNNEMMTRTPDLLERDLMYVANVFHKTYNSFSDRAAIMRNAGCDPYCRQISRVEVEGRIMMMDEGNVGNVNVNGLQPNTLTAAAAKDEDEECVPIQLVLQASGTYWTGCDAASTVRTTSSRSSTEPEWPGLFGEDDFASRTSNNNDNNIDPSGWTRRRVLSESSYLRSSSSETTKERRQQEEEENECPVCSQDTIPSFSSNEFVAVMDRFVATQLPASICSLVSVNEKKK
mmetsp:Transcript_57823/g.141233  ORF Transcript_57823/g.141233 Transcript_57823/m.141233 type:complete len:427 (+) Transcript_57823:437-1717(+)|eukprot:CAMPEP_0113473980 /NCGR_PEP_ID=MMETSP0014_2-20120614/18335_1 /TAXON_ID=2857 /ORGANISM="Nitzschia sp." /LENGTH=426 /DNA_ID=CAMNT_0000366787 /DNA_START=317 /DNA_END=1597 /DNA_ORIENTATION=+ /assembly_acc=CAM_ASM_000159